MCQSRISGPTSRSGGADGRSRSSKQTLATTQICSFDEDPQYAATEARLFWSPELDPAVVHLSARPTSVTDTERFDLFDLPVPATILRLRHGPDQLLLGTPGFSARFCVTGGELTQGCVYLAFHLGGVRRLELHAEVLRRLVAWQRHRACAMPRDRSHTVLRRLEILRTLDAMVLDPRHRAIADALYGSSRVAAEWNGRSDYLKSRVRRLVAQAEYLLGGGYREVLMMRRAL